MARKCQSKNPTQCPIHGMGGKQEQLYVELNKALAKNDISKSVELRQQLDSLSDAEGSKEEAKLSFFGRLKSNLKKPVSTSETATPETATPVSESNLEEKEAYKGLMTDCGKCNSCDPPPSDLTHFRNWNNGTCERPVPMPVSEVAQKVLSKNFSYISGLTSAQKEEVQSKVTALLEEPLNRQPMADSDASRGAEEIRNVIWHKLYAEGGSKRTSVSQTGFTSAAITSDLFYALGREKELGWIEQDAPGYGHQVERNLRTDALFSSMQQLASESPASFKRKH